MRRIMQNLPNVIHRVSIVTIDTKHEDRFGSICTYTRRAENANDIIPVPTSPNSRNSPSGPLPLHVPHACVVRAREQYIVA